MFIFAQFDLKFFKQRRADLSDLLCPAKAEPRKAFESLSLKINAT